MIDVFKGLFILAFLFADGTGDKHIIRMKISISGFVVFKLLQLLMTGSAHHDVEAIHIGHRWFVAETDFTLLFFVIFVEFLMFCFEFILFLFSFSLFGLFGVGLDWNGFGAVVVRAFRVFGVELVAKGTVVELEFGFAIGTVFLSGLVGFVVLNLNLC